MTTTERVAEVCGCTTTGRIKLGMCNKHYHRHRSALNPKPSRRKPLEQRFWAKVDIAGPNDCWRWTAKHDRGGYGQFSYRADGRCRTKMAHRYAYELMVGPIPDGLQLDHVRARGCIHRDCVNPAHLEPVTVRENLLRSPTWAGKNAVKEACPKGHPYDLTILNPDGSFRQRNCSTCIKETHQRHRRKQIEETP